MTKSPETPKIEQNTQRIPTPKPNKKNRDNRDIDW